MAYPPRGFVDKTTNKLLSTISDIKSKVDTHETSIKLLSDLLDTTRTSIDKQSDFNSEFFEVFNKAVYEKSLSDKQIIEKIEVINSEIIIIKDNIRELKENIRMFECGLEDVRNKINDYENNCVIKVEEEGIQKFNEIETRIQSLTENIQKLDKQGVKQVDYTNRKLSELENKIEDKCGCVIC